MTFPTLYKKNSSGSIQYWIIIVDDDMSRSIITARYGQLGTDNPQETKDIISDGKNHGKKNQTTHWEQAISEANSKWGKQKKKGYVESVEDAEAGELDELIEGGVVPMLAHDFKKHGHKIIYPAFVQPKLDGLRCIAILKDGKCELWSRSRKRITSCPHIIAEIEKMFGKQYIVLDGELYSHKFKANFEYIVSLVRQEEPDPNHKDVEYHVYDMVNDLPFIERARALQSFRIKPFEYAKFVSTEEVENEEQIINYFHIYKELGYEGCMVRNQDSKYVNKRSYDLLKVKEFDDSEFEIVGAEEGRGKLAGHVGAFVCKDEKGQTFLAKMSGSTDKLVEYFRDPSLYLGKKLTVQYQGLTGLNGVPRFPVGLRIIESE